MNSHEIRTPQELDFLVNTLRNPDPSVSVQTILGYLYNYLPYVKQEHNLRIVFSSFLNNPVCFGTQPPSYRDNYLILEVFKLLTEKKLRVSQPTLSVRTFYSVISKELVNFVCFNRTHNSWKVLPIIAGISLSSELRDHLSGHSLGNRGFFSSFDLSMKALFTEALQCTVSDSTHPDILNLALISLAVKYQREENLSSYVGNISPSIIVTKLLYLLYGDNGDNDGANCYKIFGKVDANDGNLQSVLTSNITQNPVVKHLNRISFLLEELFRGLPYNEKSNTLIYSSLELLLAFNNRMNGFVEGHKNLNRGTENLHPDSTYEQQFWLLQKSILFSQVLIFQGILSRFMSMEKVGLIGQFIATKKQTSVLEESYRAMCYTILHCLYYLNYILMAIGQGGFDGYNFVYYICLEITLKNNKYKWFEFFSRRLIGNYEVNVHHSTLNVDYVSRCKVLFVLGLWENYLQQSPIKDLDFVRYVFSVAFDLVKDPYLNDSHLCEASHSVLLAYFSNKSGGKDMQQVLSYFELLAGQFPQKLTAHQLSVAVETVGKEIMANPLDMEDGLHRSSIDAFLNFVYFKCTSITPGQPIKAQNGVLFTSAQPVSEIEASSTMSQLKKNDKIDIIKENKGKKPKDHVFVDILPKTFKQEKSYVRREEPKTSREGVLMAFFNVIPYLPMSIFVHWLDKMWSLIMASNQEEQAFLVERFWKVLSENLDLNRCGIAFEWWYETKRAVQENIGHRQQIIKL